MVRKHEAAHRRQRIKALAEAGLPSNAIAMRLGVPVHTVQKLRNEMGLAPTPRRISDEDKARAAALMAEGAPWPEVDRTLGWTRGTARRLFPDQGWSAADHVHHQNETHTRPSPTLVRTRDKQPGPDRVEGPPR